MTDEHLLSSVKRRGATRLSSTMLSLLKQPAVHFIVAGAAIFIATRWVAPSTSAFGAGDPHLIVIDAEQIESLRTKEQVRRGVSPTGPELDALIEAAGVDEMLYREALARGLDAGDAVVERRLVQDMRFLSDAPSTDDDVLLRQARALGLQSSDPVIRRRLIQKMRFLLTEQRGDAPTEEDLRSFFEEHRDELAAPPRVRLSHIFFSGPQAPANASSALAELVAANAGPEVASRRGEPFLSGSTLPPSGERGLAKLFGNELAHACMSLPVGRWSGPIRSAYGVHLVWIHERNTGAAPSYDLVRDRVRRRLEADRAAARLHAGIAALRARYRLDVGAPRS